MKKILSMWFVWFAFSLPIMVVAQPRVVFTGFSAPTGMAIDQEGAIYVTNWSGNSVVKINKNGKKEAIGQGVSSPSGIAVDAQKNVYVASYSDNTITLIRPNGQQTVLARGYHTPAGLSWAQNGDLLVNNRASGEVVSVNVGTQKQTVLARGLNLPVGAVQMGNGDLVVAQFSGALTLIPKQGARKELGAQFTRPGVGIVIDGPDRVVAVDYGAGALRRVNLNTGVTTLVAEGLSGSVALAKQANGSYLVGTWGEGNLYLIP